MTTSSAELNSLQDHNGAAPMQTAITVVIDTNVVLDLYLFNEPRVQHLQQALADQDLRWIATERMLEELSHVLRRPALAHWGHDSDHVMHTAMAQCQLVVSKGDAHGRVPRCTDPDDQMFIDLAWRWPASLLFSRDRALLRLARPARLHGLWIGTPERWAPPG